MGCVCARRGSAAVSPKVAPDPVPSSGTAQDNSFTSLVPTSPGPDAASDQPAAKVDGGPEEEESDGLEDLGEDSDSSESEPGASPEQQWMRQARRQERQTRRRRRARRAAKKAAANAANGERSEAEGVKTALGASLDEFYTIGERIGRGTYSSVSRCTHVESQVVRALKTIERKKSSGEEQLKEEVEVMRLLDQGQHPHVVKLYDTFEDARCVHIVMELCSGGELFSRLSEETKAATAETTEPASNCRGSKGLPESVAARVAAQIAAAVDYMHSQKVAHRDLKLENFMLAQHKELAEAQLKVIDFGLSRRFSPGQFMRTLACTAQYVAPEVLDGRYTEACDLWSIGVIYYALLCGVLPFCGESEAKVLQEVRKGFSDFDVAAQSPPSEEAAGIVRKLLVKDPEQRMTATQLRQEHWLQGSGLTL